MMVVIPVKSRSRRLPNKNFLPFRGLPLFMWTIQQAEYLRIPIIVAGDNNWTKENIDFIHCTKAIYMNRPDNLATDTADSWDVVKWAVKAKTDVLMLQVTSPLRKIMDIREALDLFEETGKAVTSTCEGKPNGSIYVRKHEEMKTDDWIPYEMPPERSLDIDTMEDYRRAITSFPATGVSTSQATAKKVLGPDAGRGGSFNSRGGVK